LGAPIFTDIDVSGTSNQNIPRDDPDAVYVVTGASRGIGKQFCETFLQDYQGTIVACCRNPTRDLSLSNPDRVIPLALDLADPITIQKAGEELKSKLQGRPVHVLLNVAGILHDETHMPERALSQIQPDWFLQTMQVNVLGPILWTQQVLPLMQQANAATTPTPRIIANLSARVGSITDNQLGGWYSYRMSKSALNQFTRTTALELARVRRNQAPVYCVALHPGTTRTDLSQPFQRNVKPESLFAPEYTVEQLLQVLQHLEAKHSGGLYDYAGKAISF
jgi:NAD(P)-dependent dehydrogenase (short-subunit alcohol dehydrogenase family)